MPTACAPSSIDSMPRTLASRGVTCRIVSTPTCCSISADAISAFMRARASGLSFTSKRWTWPEAARVRAEAIMRSTLPPLGGSSSTETTNSPLRSLASSSVSTASASARIGSSRSTSCSATAGARRSLTARLMAATCSGVVPQQPPIEDRTSARAWAAYSPKYSGTRIGVDDPPARDVGQAGIRLGCQRQVGGGAHLLDPLQHGLRAEAAVDAHRGRHELRHGLRDGAGREPGDGLGVVAHRHLDDQRQVGDRAHGPHRGQELLERRERLECEKIDSAALERGRLGGERGGHRRGRKLARRHAERPDRSRHQHIPARHLARLAGQLHPGLVDRLEPVVELCAPPA